MLEDKMSLTEGHGEMMALPDAGGTLAPTVPVALGGGGGGTVLLERSKDRSKCWPGVAHCIPAWAGSPVTPGAPALGGTQQHPRYSHLPILS